ncbi:hypothetical protein BC830DRAFT_97310 [Chytriomyces sp. MP71]|nr:hypothetical protein BC830DRAFT_97310 [Chytriomyces sp. MP71]
MLLTCQPSNSTSFHGACIDGDQLAVLRALINSPLEPIPGMTRAEHECPSGYLDVNVPDEGGTPPLVYASCFGHGHIVRLLLAAGANADCTDRNGWSPLMWAVANSHHAVAALLVSHGAATDHTNSAGQTIRAIERSASSLSVHPYDGHGGNAKHALSLGVNRDRFSTPTPVPVARSTPVPGRKGHRFTSRASSMHHLSDLESDASSVDDNFDSQSANTLFQQISSAVVGSVGTAAGDKNKNRLSLVLKGGSLAVTPFRSNRNSQGAKDTHTSVGSRNGEEEDEDVISRTPFVWDSCKVDQIMIFEEKNISRILQISISTLRPTRLTLGKPIPANVIFLCSRYALYLSTNQLLNEFLEEAVRAVSKEIREHCHSIQILSFWLSNCSHLLYYFQKDPTLSLATPFYQHLFAELIHEVFDLLSAQIRFNLGQVVDAAILDYTDPEAMLEFSPPPTPTPSTILGTLTAEPDVDETVAGALSKPLLAPPTKPFSVVEPETGSWSFVRRLTRYSIASISVAASSVSRTMEAASSGAAAIAKEAADIAIIKNPAPPKPKRLVAYHVIASENTSSRLESRQTHIFNNGPKPSFGGGETDFVGADFAKTQVTAPPPPTKSAFAISITPPKQSSSFMYRHPINASESPQVNKKPVTPRTITSLLTKLSTTLQLSHVHPILSRTVMQQSLATLNALLVEGVLSGDAERRSRTRSVCIRMNLGTALDHFMRKHAFYFLEEEETASAQGFQPISMQESADSVVTAEEEGKEDAEDLDLPLRLQNPCMQVIQLTRLLHVLASLDSVEAYVDVVSDQLNLVTPPMAMRVAQGRKGLNPDVAAYVEKMGLAFRELQDEGEVSGDEWMWKNVVQQSVMALTIPFWDGGLGFDEEEDGSMGWKPAKPFVPDVVLRLLDGVSEVADVEESEGDTMW